MDAEVPPFEPIHPVHEVVIIEPTAAEKAPPIEHAAHGYTYSVRKNALLAERRIIEAIDAAETPQEAVESLTRAFRQAGYFLVALRAELDEERKHVRVEVVQGRLSETIIEPEVAAYYRGLKGRDDIRSREVIRRTVVAEQYATRQGVRPQLDFAPADEFAASRMTVDLEPVDGARPWDFGLAAGNFGSRFSSRYQATAFAALRPGMGFEITGEFTEGLPRLDSDSRGSDFRSYNLGVTHASRFGVYGVDYRNTDYLIGDVAAPLNPDGEIERWRFTGEQIAFADGQSRLALNQAFTEVSNKVDVFDGVLQLSNQRYSYFTLGSTYNRSFSLLGQRAGAAAKLEVNRGVSGRQGTLAPAGDGVPDPKFTYWTGRLDGQMMLPYGMNLQLEVRAQETDDTLPSQEQWVLGGYRNVSAYFPGVISGDKGVFTRLMLNSPATSWAGLSFRGNLFAEVATSRENFRPEGTPSSQMLSATGVELTATTAFGSSLSVLAATPIQSTRVPSEVRSDNRADFYFIFRQGF